MTPHTQFMRIDIAFTRILAEFLQMVVFGLCAGWFIADVYKIRKSLERIADELTRLREITR